MRKRLKMSITVVHHPNANKLNKKEQKGSTKTNPMSLSTLWSKYFNATVPSIDPAA